MSARAHIFDPESGHCWRCGCHTSHVVNLKRECLEADNVLSIMPEIERRKQKAIDDHVREFWSA